MSATGNAAGNASVNELESTPWLLRILLRVPLREDGVIFFVCTVIFFCFIFCFNIRRGRPAVAQWLRRCAAEPKDVGSIPGRGGRFSDGGEKQKRPCVRDFGAR